MHAHHKRFFPALFLDINCLISQESNLKICERPIPTTMLQHRLLYRHIILKCRSDQLCMTAFRLADTHHLRYFNMTNDLPFYILKEYTALSACFSARLILNFCPSAVLSANVSFHYPTGPTSFRSVKCCSRFVFRLYSICCFI